MLLDTAMRASCVAVVLGAALPAAALPAAAQTQPAIASERAVRRGVCAGRRACRLESVLPAGPGPGGAALAVVRVRLPGGCVDVDPDDPGGSYEDWLVAIGRGRARRLRQLAFGDTPCLEHTLSEWTFEGGELVFHYGAMGPPSGLRATAAERRRVHVHLRPWPLEVTAEILGSEPVAPRPLPARGPLFVLSME